MHKKINLRLIANTDYSNIKEDYIKQYLGLENTKEYEIETIYKFCEYLKTEPIDHQLYENYYVNYKIPQIEKEFDLLRIGNNSIVNIELKSQSVAEEKMLKQLKRNHYYLSFLEKTIHCYVFISDEAENKLFYFNNENSKLEPIDQNHIFCNINELEDIESNTINSLFTPSNYLISPFNATEKFIDGKYFLTQQQEKIKDEIIKEINKNGQNRIFSISGMAGTGKTLLTYDLAKELRQNRSVTIVHCAKENNGIVDLRQKYHWKIEKIKNYSVDNESSEILIFDEAHRMSLNQLRKIFKQQSKILIFSHDVHQRLNHEAEQVVDYIKNNSKKHNELTNKIRQNKPLSSFIQKLFDLEKINRDNFVENDYANISIYYAKNESDAEEYIGYLQKKGWEYIYLSTDLRRPDPLDKVQFNSNKSAHEVIGQEYDNVVIAMTNDFFHHDNGKLDYKNKLYYDPVETLFQAITRTRRKLTLVIINNEIYKTCMKIINRCKYSQLNP